MVPLSSLAILDMYDSPLFWLKFRHWDGAMLPWQTRTFAYGGKSRLLRLPLQGSQ